MISRAQIMARCRYNSLGTKASSAGVLMSLLKAAVVVPLDLLFRIDESVPSTSRVRREDLAVCTDLEPVFAAEVLCAFLHSEDPNNGPNVAAPQDLTVLLQERCRTTWTCSLFSRTSSTGSVPSGPNCCSSASFVMTLS